MSDLGTADGTHYADTLASEPAFPQTPVIETSGDAIWPEQTGMTLRDYFAGQVIATLIKEPIHRHSDNRGIAQDAYEVADVMLEARKENV